MTSMIRASDALSHRWFPETAVPSFSKHMRKAAWRAIEKDDPGALFGEILTSEELVMQAACGLWNPDKLAGIREKPLVEVLATQQRGTPAHGQGPIRCLDALLSRHMHVFSEDELSQTIYHATYCARPLAVSCIQWYIASRG